MRPRERLRHLQLKLPIAEHSQSIPIMNTPTHEEIARQAHRLSEESGPSGGDSVENWLAAERVLSANKSKSPPSPTSAESAADHTLSESQSALATTERAAQQRKIAREPQSPTHTGPKATPSETGKPLWSQPHSS